MMTDNHKALVERVARALCDDEVSRRIAKQTDAPSYAESAEHVQAYWREITRAAIAAIQATDPIDHPRTASEGSEDE